MNDDNSDILQEVVTEILSLSNWLPQEDSNAIQYVLHALLQSQIFFGAKMKVSSYYAAQALRIIL